MPAAFCFVEFDSRPGSHVPGCYGVAALSTSEVRRHLRRKRLDDFGIAPPDFLLGTRFRLMNGGRQPTRNPSPRARPAHRQVFHWTLIVVRAPDAEGRHMIKKEIRPVLYGDRDQGIGFRGGKHLAQPSVTAKKFIPWERLQSMRSCPEHGSRRRQKRRA